MAMATKQSEKDTERALIPCCDISENNSGICVRIEMPGVAKDGLEIKIDRDLLIISGKKMKARAKGDYLLHEIQEGNFLHEFTIDETIDRNKIEASLEKGVLNLTLGIKESEKPRKINIVAR